MSGRKVIENVPKVAFAPIHDGQFEFTPYPSCLKAILKHLAESVDYHYLLATSGGAFRFLWHIRIWEPGAVDLIFMSENPLEPFEKALDAAGYQFEITLNSTYKWSDELSPDIRKKYFSNVMESEESVFKEKIMESIDHGVPVVAFGVVGPPEACIITGYDNAGKVLIGWSMFQEHLDPIHDISAEDMNAPAGVEDSGYFRQTDWHKKLAGIITLGKKAEVDLSQVYMNTLERIPAIIKTPRVHGFYTGQKAYKTYIEKMLDDTEFADNDLNALAMKKLVHYDAMTMIAERGSGAAFLRRVADHPDFQTAKNEIEQAADAFEAAANQMGGWWKVVGQMWEDEEAQVKATADAKARRAFVPYIRTSKEKDLEGAEHILRACEILG